MPVCNHCNRNFEPLLDAEQQACPNCGELVAIHENWQVVVRSTNIAEAGYLVNLLQEKGIEATLDQQDSYSAITGQWEPAFLLKVPPEFAIAAAEHLKESLSEDSEPNSILYAEENSAAEHRRSDPSVPLEADWPVANGRVAFVILLFFAALFMAMFAFFNQSKVKQKQTPDAELSETLQQVLTAINKPFIAAPTIDDPRQYRLRFQEDSQAWILDIDEEGNGTYDKRLEFAK